MLLRTLAIAAALCATSIQGFAPSAPSMRVQTARNLMTAEEVKAIIDEAEGCAQGECALDEVEDLISSLLAQQSQLSKRIAEIDGLVKDLEHVNGRDERPVDEIRETVRAIFRIFALGVSYFLLTFDAFSYLILTHTYANHYFFFRRIRHSTLVSLILSCSPIFCIGQGQWKRLPLTFQAYGILW